MKYKKALTLILAATTISFTPLQAQKQQKGKASYYPKRATGARTSSGERIHHDSLTCAHRTHAFGTLLKVTNPNNGKSVIVRVTDRGPHHRGRIIDLSWGAAKELGMISQGVATVIVERYNETIVPFKDESKYEIPEMDFETNEDENDKDGMHPAWRNSEKKADKKGKK